MAKQYCGSWFRRVQKAVSCQDPVLSNYPFFPPSSSVADATLMKEIDKYRLLLAGFNIDHVFSSCMLRAMETAHALFPSHIVVPAPHIGEKGLGYDNVALKWTDQKQILEKQYDRNLTWLDESKAATCREGERVNFTKFSQWLVDNYVSTTTNSKNTFAVVSHAHFLKALFKQLRLPWKQVWNSSIFKVTFEISGTSLVRHPTIEPEKIWSGFQPKEEWEPWFADRCQSSCQSLVQNCSKRKAKQEQEKQ